LIAVVTGGTADVGRATARVFARAAFDVAVLARGLERLEATVGELHQTGVRALPVQADVADEEAIERAAARSRTSSARSTSA
jgi:NADP-dependent 3-hydroxy acid dehydrogenase YdfG